MLDAKASLEWFLRQCESKDLMSPADLGVWIEEAGGVPEWGDDDDRRPRKVCKYRRTFDSVVPSGAWVWTPCSAGVMAGVAD